MSYAIYTPYSGFQPCKPLKFSQSDFQTKAFRKAFTEQLIPVTADHGIYPRVFHEASSTGVFVGFVMVCVTVVLLR